MEKIWSKFILLVLFSALLSSTCFSQEVKVNVETDTNKILIGDHIKYQITIHSKPATEIILPELKDSVGRFELIEIGKVDTQKINDELILKRRYTLTIFDSGTYFIPSLPILYQKKGLNQYATIYSDSIPIYVKGIEVDTTKDIKDIKGIIEVPFTFLDYLPYIIIIVVAIGLAYLIYFILKKRKKAEQVSEEMKIPPHILALKELKQLDSEKLWQKGEIKEYHIRLTEIVRKYIERSFKIPALEMISSEIIDSLSKINSIDPKLVDKMRRAFEISDLVKFAKFVPLPDEHTYCMKVAIEFVEATSPQNVEQSSSEEK